MQIIKGLQIGLMVGIIISSTAFADSQNGLSIYEVQSAIVRARAHWTPKESWVSRLSNEELTRMMGLPYLPKSILDYETLTPYDAQGSIDWRNKDGINWLGPVMNQGNCGSCVAFASIATLEAQTTISVGLPWLRPTYSPQALFACGGGGCDTGWLPGRAAQYLERNGTPDEACMPYTSGSTGLDVSCNTMCNDANHRSTRITNYSSPSGFWHNDAAAVKAALKKGPLVTTLTVYEDFVTYGGGVYRHVTGPAVGGHAVSLVGYDDTKRAWLIRNSWGTEWGEQGFAWMSWDDVSGIGSETWQFELPTSEQTLTVTAPAEHQYVSGQFAFAARTHGLSGQSLSFHLTDSKGREITQLNCSNSADETCQSVMDTTQLPEGRYEIRIESPNHSSLKSQTRAFWVINSEPKMNLSFTPAPGVNLNKPLNGRPEFLVTAESKPVPIQHVELRVINASGAIVSVKGNDDVLEQMKMGWRTLTVPNGQYKLIFHGETQYLGRTYNVDSNYYMITVKN